MKRIFFLLIMALTLASCSPRLTESVQTSYPNGQPELVLMFNKAGECVRRVEYYESGTMKMEGAMKNGQRDGEWTAYFRDGRVQSHGYFKDGERTGESKVYWSNGNLRYVGHYHRGTHCGKWTWYDEQGNFLREENYGDCD